MRGFFIGVVLAAFSCEAHAGDRAAQLVNSFQVMCTIEPLDFARSDIRATAMKLTVRKDINPPPDASGYFARSKSWLLPLKSGPHEFVVSEVRGPNGDFKTCGIGAPDVEADDFRAELAKAMKLGQPVTETKSPDGTFRNTVWGFGDLSLMLSDGSPRNVKQGIYLFLSNKPLVR